MFLGLANFMFIGAAADSRKIKDNMKLNIFDHNATGMIIPVKIRAKADKICIHIKPQITAILTVHSNVHLFIETCPNYRCRQVKCSCVIGSQLKT